MTLRGIFKSKIIKDETVKEVVREVPVFILECGCKFRLDYSISIYSRYMTGLSDLIINDKSKPLLKCNQHKLDAVKNAVESFNKLQKNEYKQEFILQLNKITGISLCDIEKFMDKTP